MVRGRTLFGIGTLFILRSGHHQANVVRLRQSVMLARNWSS
jgi:hypothetical protein